jgi:hypothetical protein
MTAMPGPVRESSLFQRIISGGQTGVDRAALDAALGVGLECGGWCPKGRRAEDGAIPRRYPLQETPATSYRQRTEWNVRDSDGTLVLVAGTVGRGTALTQRFAQRLDKPLLTLDLRLGPAPRVVWDWAKRSRVSILNVAGPRESHSPGIQLAASEFLRGVFSLLVKREGSPG